MTTVYRRGRPLFEPTVKRMIGVAWSYVWPVLFWAVVLSTVMYCVHHAAR
jgi:hypothetical protein